MGAVDRLAQIEARAQAATEGPWAGAWFEDCESHIVYDDDSGEHVIAEAVDLADDAAFIAHARTDVPALVAALRAVLDLAQGEDEHEDYIARQEGRSLPHPFGHGYLSTPRVRAAIEDALCGEPR